MDELFSGKLYNPDILCCLANLSNDEVFTPPNVANQMIDLLPPELFSDPDTKFLDPFCKSGVFLREIAKRLIEGLKDKIPDLKERIDHIFHNQIYGIAITELTSFLSRRSLYCSKYPNSKYSVSHFDNPEGNIRYKRVNHTFKNGRCIYCGASEGVYNRGHEFEQYAYELIHTKNPEEIFNMKFDVIIGNPPYQLNIGIEQESYAIPLYHKFIEQAEKLNPKFLSMIIPARWFSGGRGLDEFRNKMLKDDRIRVLHDYINANDCFSGVEIKGGVCYFLWNRDSHGTCDIYTHQGEQIEKSNRYLLENNCDTFIRFSKAISILRKVNAKKCFSDIVSSQTPFGLYSSFKDFTDNNNGNFKVYANKQSGYLINNSVISRNDEMAKEWKVYVPKAIGSGDTETDIIKPFVGEPNSVCTQTYLMIGPFLNKDECENVITYIKTKFFHFMVGIKKVTQDAMSKVYSLVPLQDFSKSWTDEELYKKYNLTQEEIYFIEKSVWPDKEDDNNGQEN